MAHEPLSRGLERLASEPGIETLNDLVARTHGRGIYLGMILLCLPFVAPIPLPGYSNIVGVALLVVAVRLWLRLPTRLPNFIGARPWSAERMQRVIRGSIRVLHWIEKVVKPRRTIWLSKPWSVRLNASFLGFMALLLALPIPPVIPFSNSLPAHGIIWASAAMMEEDGAAIWFAYGIGVLTVIYFALFAGAIARFYVLHETRIIEFLRDLL
jgi:hypothetical protein